MKNPCLRRTGHQLTKPWDSDALELEADLSSGSYRTCGLSCGAMHLGRWIVTVSVFGVIGLIPLLAQRGATPPAAVDDPVKTLADRLDLEKYKAILRGLAQFGDRRQGTERNRQAVDWIEAQLKDSGCTNTERIRYM